MGERETVAPAARVDPSDARSTTRTRLIAGAMSGTSGDGVDVAISAITGRGLAMNAKLVRHHHVPYDAELRRLLFAIRERGSTSLADLAKLGRQISLTYARAVNEALAAGKLTARDLAAVAAHGQTLFHSPPDTIQWFDPALVAAEVGCAVVSDFRRADLAAGGQGAPLVPYADYILFRHPTRDRVAVNIGGIANVTILRGGCSIDNVIAFDTGPGNCISDYLCRAVDPTGPGFDEDGRIARCGSVHSELTQHLKSAAYFNQPPPKSTDGPAMIALFEEARRAARQNFAVADLIASAAWLTVWAITREIPKGAEVVVSGGGIRNTYFRRGLEMAAESVITTDELGVPSDAKEALAFALLGAATLDGEPSNVPSVTGAKRRVVLGSITPAPCPPG
jgi:anhydro-N-acetylmuramic acid kinase